MAEAKLTKDELEYHKRVIALLNEASAIYHHWNTYITNKYQLAKGERFGENGDLVGLPASPPMPPMPSSPPLP